jgi:predicted ATPase
VTLMGPAGTGKTRLALAVAEQLVEAWQGAVYFVPLADLTDPQRIVDAIRDAMRLPRSADGDRSEATSGAAQVVEALARHPALLVLDNFEHLVEAGAPVVQRLLERLPTLTILVTSRQRLNLAGEQEFLVSPLPPPPESIRPEELVRCPSVQLFVDRAQAVRPDFQVTAGTAAAVAALCQRLEGIPLALELAAARAGVLTPAQMVARLEQRFELLAQRRSVDARHQSLRAALDWSYQLLPAAMQRFFAALSLFRGGFTLAAAEAVCRAGEGRSSGPALDDVTELRECSLVDVVEVGDAARYRLLETLREYGAERLQEEPEQARAAADRHAQYYLAFAEERAARMRTREEARALTELGEELDNLRAGMDWAQASEQGELCARLALALYPALHGRGFWEEARSRLQVGRVAVEDQEGDARGSLAAIHCHLAGLAQDMGDLAEARRQAEASLGLHRELNDAQGTAEALNVLGLLVRDEGDVEAARRCFDDALTLLTDADHARRGMVLNNLASLAFRRGVVEEARQLYQQSLTLLRTAGDLRHEVTTLNNLGFLAHQYDADRAEARRLYQESLALCRELHNDQGVAVMLNNLGELAEVEGDVPTAVGLLVHAERIFRDARSAHVAVPAASLDRLSRQLGAEPFAALRAEAEQVAWEELVERTCAATSRRSE